MLRYQLLLATLATLSHHAIAAVGITGPLLQVAHADPCITQTDSGELYSFATNQGKGKTAINVPVAKAPTLRGGWNEVTNKDGSPYDALPTPGAWTTFVTEGDAKVGGPDVNQLGPKKFVMYYAAQPKGQNPNIKHDIKCIGVATATTALGPYTAAEEPLVCQENVGQAKKGTGFIGANYFKDNGHQYLVYKIGSAFDPERISRTYLQQLNDDGTSIDHAYPPYKLITSTPNVNHIDKDHDQNDTEGAALVKHPNGGYVLFFNGGFFRNPDYRIEYAINPSSDIRGTYTRHGVLLRTGNYPGDSGQQIPIFAPGGADFVGTSNTDMTFMAYRNDQGEPSSHLTSQRLLHAAKIAYDGNKITVAT
ncbi:MAG: hypothetical protein M1828_007139 [Chrysothrix sp. TS-e1954]|nr:MAG: hypothetical protein M1828_007139 [Chrysothrix sp. TS-e1954]